MTRREAVRACLGAVGAASLCGTDRGIVADDVQVVRDEIVATLRGRVVARWRVLVGEAEWDGWVVTVHTRVDRVE